MKFLVGGKWELDLPDDERVHDGKLGTFVRPYTWFVAHKVKDISTELWCYDQLLSCLSGVTSVLEYFGGVGCDATLIRNMLHPATHILMDLDTWQTELLSNLFPECTVYQGDFFVDAGFEFADLICLDFNSFTMLQLQRQMRLSLALSKALSRCNAAIITDTAVHKIWLNAKHYATIAKQPVTDLYTYLQAMSCYLYQHYDVSIQMAASHANASYYLVAPTQPIKFEHVVATEQAKTSHFRKLV